MTSTNMISSWKGAITQLKPIPLLKSETFSSFQENERGAMDNRPSKRLFTNSLEGLKNTEGNCKISSIRIQVSKFLNVVYNEVARQIDETSLETSNKNSIDGVEKKEYKKVHFSSPLVTGACFELIDDEQSQDTLPICLEDEEDFHITDSEEDSFDGPSFFDNDDRSFYQKFDPIKRENLLKEGDLSFKDLFEKEDVNVFKADFTIQNATQLVPECVYHDGSNFVSSRKENETTQSDNKLKLNKAVSESCVISNERTPVCDGSVIALSKCGESTGKRTKKDLAFGEKSDNDFIRNDKKVLEFEQMIGDEGFGTEKSLEKMKLKSNETQKLPLLITNEAQADSEEEWHSEVRKRKLREKCSLDEHCMESNRIHEAEDNHNGDVEIYGCSRQHALPLLAPLSDQTVPESSKNNIIECTTTTIKNMISIGALETHPVDLSPDVPLEVPTRDGPEKIEVSADLMASTTEYNKIEFNSKDMSPILVLEENEGFEALTARTGTESMTKSNCKDVDKSRLTILQDDVKLRRAAKRKTIRSETCKPAVKVFVSQTSSNADEASGSKSTATLEDSKVNIDEEGVFEITMKSPTQNVDESTVSNVALNFQKDVNAVGCSKICMNKVISCNEETDLSESTVAIKSGFQNDQNQEQNVSWNNVNGENDASKKIISRNAISSANLLTVETERENTSYWLKEGRTMTSTDKFVEESLENAKEADFIRKQCDKNNKEIVKAGPGTDTTHQGKSNQAMTVELQTDSIRNKDVPIRGIKSYTLQVKQYNEDLIEEEALSSSMRNNSLEKKRALASKLSAKVGEDDADNEISMKKVPVNNQIYIQKDFCFNKPDVNNEDLDVILDEVIDYELKLSSNNDSKIGEADTCLTKNESVGDLYCNRRNSTLVTFGKENIQQLLELESPWINPKNNKNAAVDIQDTQNSHVLEATLTNEKMVDTKEIGSASLEKMFTVFGGTGGNIAGGMENIKIEGDLQGIGNDAYILMKEHLAGWKVEQEISNSEGFELSEISLEVVRYCNKQLMGGTGLKDERLVPEISQDRSLQLEMDTDNSSSFSLKSHNAGDQSLVKTEDEAMDYSEEKFYDDDRKMETMKATVENMHKKEQIINPRDVIQQKGLKNSSTITSKAIDRASVFSWSNQVPLCSDDKGLTTGDAQCMMSPKQLIKKDANTSLCPLRLGLSKRRHVRRLHPYLDKDQMNLKTSGRQIVPNIEFSDE